MPNGIMICDDLIFTSRVAATARAHGSTVASVKSTDQARRSAVVVPPDCVIVDLHLPGLDLPELMTGLRAVCPDFPRVVAFGSHVDVAALKAARSAGADVVMPRSQFVERLEAELPGWLNGRRV